jgi:thiol-disulfide isomerase/thioredoxin
MTRARWISMIATAAALALFMFPYLQADGVPVPEAVAEAAGEACDKDAKPAPLDYTIKDMNGVDVKLSSFKGKVILLNFWATWCGPCKAEIPGFVELQKQYANDLVVLGLSVDDPVEKLKPYAAQYKINYPVLVGLGRDDVQEAYGPLWGIPVSFLIGRDGRICKKHMGIAPKAQFEREIKALL